MGNLTKWDKTYFNNGEIEFEIHYNKEKRCGVRIVRYEEELGEEDDIWWEVELYQLGWNHKRVILEEFDTLDLARIYVEMVKKEASVILNGMTPIKEMKVN